MNRKEIALVDCDSFFVACEQLINPTLNNKPVCVMSNNDGCVIARSKEAKQLGITMGMPAFIAKKEFPQATYLSGNMALYGEVSARVMTKLKEFSPIIENYSIDEAFLDLTGLRRMYRKSYLEIAMEIRNRIKNEVGVPVSVGLGSSKTLAKLATSRAKKTNGIHRISFRKINEELKQTKLIDVWGIGSNSSALLNKYGITTAYELTLIENNRLRNLFGKKGVELKYELLGDSIYQIQDKYVAPKSIQKTSSFAKFTSDETYIKKSIHYHVHRACSKLRRQGLKTGTVGIMLRTKDFRVQCERVTLFQPTDWEFDINKAVNLIFEKIYHPRTLYRSSGVYLEDLNEQNQISLFSSVTKLERNNKLSAAWDKLENRYGRGVIVTG